MQCYNSRRVFRSRQDIAAMQEMASSREGRCLSTEYLGSKAKLTWQCAREHRWEAVPVSVLQGTWCPVCAHSQRLELAALHKIAASRGGGCLSQTYANERTALAWYCAAGHRWSATPGKVKRGSWCPKCASIRKRSKWTLPRVIEPLLVERAPAIIESQPNRLVVDAGIDRPSRLLKDSSLESLGGVVRMPRPPASADKSH